MPPRYRLRAALRGASSWAPASRPGRACRLRPPRDSVEGLRQSRSVLHLAQCRATRQNPSGPDAELALTEVTVPSFSADGAPALPWSHRHAGSWWVRLPEAPLL